VRPIVKIHRPAIYVEVIESIPKPDRIMVLIQINQDIADDRRTRHVTQGRGEEDLVVVPVG